MKSKIERLEVEQHHLFIVSEFAVSILPLTTIEQVTWHLVRDVVSRLEFEDIVIYLFDEKKQRLIQHAAFGYKNPEYYEILNPMEIEIGQGIVGKAAQSGKPILVNDTSIDPHYLVDDEARLSELAVPMFAEGVLIGVIDTEHSKKNYYTQQHLRTLVAIAAITATKIANTETIIKLQHTIEQLEYSSKIQDTLFEIAELIFATDSLKQFYQKLHACIGRLTFAKNFYVALTIDEGESLKIPYYIDEHDKVPENKTIKIDRKRPSITGYVLTRKKALLASKQDIINLIDAGKIYIEGKIPVVWLGVPFGEGESAGVVVVQNYHDDFMFTEKDKQLLSFVAKHIRNAIERMQTRAELKYLALHDPLTQLPNRTLFTDRVEHAIANLTRHTKNKIAILFLDLDKFKTVNDTYGHHIGDKLLLEVANRVKACIRKSDTLCRLGGDEFAILLESINQVSDAENVAKKIISSIQETILLEQYQLHSSTSIGISYCQEEDLTSDELLIQADEAMYQAKIHGRNQYFIFQDKTRAGHTSSYKIEHDFLNGLEKQELFLEYQPIINFELGHIVSAEALIRWQHPEHGRLAPDIFLSELEKSGNIFKLDLYVTKLALTFIKDNLNILPDHFRLGINISGAGFNALSLMQLLEHTAQESPELLKHLCIEITEQTLVGNVKQTQNNITQLAKMGIIIALDDFGTGYSSLSYLNQFTFDCLKIDRSFIRDIEEGQDNYIILETIINLAKSLNIKTIAEGIETQSQYQVMAKMQCTHGQGFYMSKPISPQKLLNLISRENQYS